MDEEAVTRYREERYLPAITWYDNRACQDQLRFAIFQWVVISLSVAVSAVAGVGLPWSRWIVAGGSAVVAVAAGTMKAFKFEENWLNYRTTCETLKKEGYYREAGLDPYGSAEDPNALFVERVESPISRENTL